MHAGDLNVGDTVKTKNGIEKLTKKEKKPGRHTVYNLEVHQSHTYYVSNIGVLAHNTKPVSGRNASQVTNGIDIPADLPRHIHTGQQGKHIVGHNNYKPGRSPLAKDINAQELLDGIHTKKYHITRLTPRGQPVVDFGKAIGQFEGKPTNFGIVHYGKNGVALIRERKLSINSWS